MPIRQAQPSNLSRNLTILEAWLGSILEPPFLSDEIEGALEVVVREARVVESQLTHSEQHILQLESDRRSLECQLRVMEDETHAIQAVENDLNLLEGWLSDVRRGFRSLDEVCDEFARCRKTFA